MMVHAMDDEPESVQLIFDIADLRLEIIDARVCEVDVVMNVEVHYWPPFR